MGSGADRVGRKPNFFATFVSLLLKVFFEVSGGVARMAFAGPTRNGKRIEQQAHKGHEEEKALKPAILGQTLYMLYFNFIYSREDFPSCSQAAICVS